MKHHAQNCWTQNNLFFNNIYYSNNKLFNAVSTQNNLFFNNIYYSNNKLFNAVSTQNNLLIKTTKNINVIYVLNKFNLKYFDITYPINTVPMTSYNANPNNLVE